MDKFNRRLTCSPISEHLPDVVESDFDKQFRPDNSAIETMLTPNDDGSLPDISMLSQNPKYAAALQQFVAEHPSTESIVDTSQLSDEELAELINNDTDLNNEFWRLYAGLENLKNDE